MIIDAGLDHPNKPDTAASMQNDNNSTVSMQI